MILTAWILFDDMPNYDLTSLTTYNSVQYTQVVSGASKLYISFTEQKSTQEIITNWLCISMKKPQMYKCMYLT